MSSELRKYVDDLIDEQLKKLPPVIPVEKDYYYNLRGKKLIVYFGDELLREAQSRINPDVIAYLSEIINGEFFSFTEGVASIKYVKHVNFKPVHEKYLFKTEAVEVLEDEVVFEGLLCEYDESFNYCETKVWDKVILRTTGVPKGKFKTLPY